MKTVILEAFRDDNTGEVGLGFAGVARHDEMNAASEGLLIAHDLIEHVNGLAAIGGIDDELEALGGIWYVRGQHGELRRGFDRASIYSIAENIAGDVTRMFRDWVYQDCPQMKYLPVTRAVTAEQDIADTLEASDESYLDNFDDDQKAEARSKWPAYRAEALVRMRAGYSKARRKWERHGRYAANTQFWAIAKAVDDAIKFGDMFEGSRFTLRYGDGDASCEQRWEEE